MKKLSLQVLSILIVCFINVANAKILTINHASEAQKIIQSNSSTPKETLMLFDIDDVIITTQDTLFHPKSNGLKAIGLFNKKIRSINGEDKLQIYWSVIFRDRKIRLVENNDTIELLKFSQRVFKGNVLSLTTAGVGEFGYIKSLKDWRFNQLRDVGIEFSSKINDISGEVLNKNIINKDKSCTPIFEKGIIFACNIDKGEVLGSFLENSKVNPKKIIFIDDKIKNLKSVEDYCTKNNIEFIGLEYLNVKNSDIHAENEKMYNFQLTMLEMLEIWIDDNKAEEIIAKLEN